MFHNLIELHSDDHFVVDMMYASLKNNMTGVAVYRNIGFGNRAFVHKDLAQRLEQTFPYLETHHLKMKIYDAYRPPLAHQKLKEVIPQPGFFASNPERSNHCHATAVDVCLCRENGEDLLYPTKVDAFRADFAAQIQKGEFAAFFEYLQQARHDYMGACAEALHNRAELLALMEGVGLERCRTEWWHYDLPDGKSELYPMIDY